MITNKFTIHTQDSTSVVRQKLINGTETSSKKLTNFTYYESLRGRVSESGFRLSRVYGGGGAITIIRGRFSKVPGGTDIHVTMYPAPTLIIIGLAFIVVDYNSTLKKISEIITMMKSFDANTSNIFEFFINVIGFLLPIIFIAFCHASELKAYRRKLTRIIEYDETE
jgi:hypothetical protein